MGNEDRFRGLIIVGPPMSALHNSLVFFQLFQFEIDGFQRRKTRKSLASQLADFAAGWNGFGGGHSEGPASSRSESSQDFGARQRDAGYDPREHFV